MMKTIPFTRVKTALLPRLAAISLVLLLTACGTTQWPDTQALLTSAPLTHQEPAKQAPPPTPEELAEIVSLRTTAALQDRLDQVAAPLLIANPDLCKRHARNLLGISARNKYSYSARLAGPAEKAFGLTDRLSVINVLPGSGADKAGVKRGDILLAVEDKTIPQGEKAENETAALLAPLVAKKTSVKLALRRNDSERSLTIPLTRACGFRVELGNSDIVNSYSDGRRILVTRGMMQFAQNDTELAYVIAKEMAHNALNHAHMLKTASAATGIIDRLLHGEGDAGSISKDLKPMPQQYDIAADTLSLQMALRAGHGIDQAVAFWQRLAEKYPASSAETHTAQHPASRARFSAMAKTVQKIKAVGKNKKAAEAG